MVEIELTDRGYAVSKDRMKVWYDVVSGNLTASVVLWLIFGVSFLGFGLWHWDLLWFLTVGGLVWLVWCKFRYSDDILWDAVLVDPKWSKELGESRILNMIGELNAVDVYIFLLNYFNLFESKDAELWCPNETQLSGVLEAVGEVGSGGSPSFGSSGVKGSPFSKISKGFSAGESAGKEAILDSIADKLGGLPRTSEVREIIKKEYLPELLRKYSHDVAVMIAVVCITGYKNEATFPASGVEGEMAKVVEDPTRENIVNYVKNCAPVGE